MKAIASFSFFCEDFSATLRKACDFDHDAMHLVCAAIVHNKMFEMKYSFNGSFKNLTEQDAVPTSLMALVRMVLDGPSIKNQSELVTSTSRAALSISQLLMFNSVKSRRGTDSSHEQHNRDCETPLAL